MAEDPIERLARGLGKLPGVGPKSARRIALDMLTWSTDDVRQLADLLVEIKTNVRECSACFNLAVEDPCPICKDTRRDTSTIMVVDAVANLIAVERTNSYRGVYHVLGGRLSPLDGIGPDDIKISELESRVESGSIREIILANEPTVEGDATAQYICKILGTSGVQITQIARGLAVGSDLSLADQVTLSRALEGRREL
jgi:recombination protein RecR